MPEDMGNHFTFPNFTTSVPGILREILDKNNTTRGKSYLNGLGITKGVSGGVYMMMKALMEVSQYYNVFNYVSPRPQKELKPQDRTIVEGPGMKQAQKLFPPGHIKQKVVKETPTDALIMDNLETLLATIVYKACGNTSVSIL